MFIFCAHHRTRPLRSCLAAALLDFTSAAKFHPFWIKPAKKGGQKKGKTGWTRAPEKYTDVFSFAFKNTHTISGCLERQTQGEGALLILTQRAQRHTISPNYRGREGGGGCKITQKIKSCLWKIWSTSQNTQTFPRSTFLGYAVISYGWPSLSLSVRLVSAQLSKAPQPPQTSLVYLTVWASLRPPDPSSNEIPFQNPPSTHGNHYRQLS